MDVKTKFALSPTEGTTADVGKDQDVDELYLETLGKEEPNGAHFSNNEQSAKYNVQKTKDSIKRQKPKGQYHGGAEENSKVVEEKLPDYGSVLVPRSRKENGNHLLNFRYERCMMRDAQNRDVWRHNNNSNRLLPPVQRHKYNKEQFVQARCQFVVTANGDYSLHLTNPDILVDWKLVEQIKFHNSENLSCPICLYPLVAGKITRCGHVFCWPCILCHLHYREEMGTYTCPICYGYIHKNDLKSVIGITRYAFNLGDTVKLRLMRREKNSLFTTPVESAIRPPTRFLSVSENADNQIFSKLLLASGKDIVNIIEGERSELELELKDNPDMAPYIKQAFNELLKREEKLLCQDGLSKDTPPTESLTEKEISEETSQGSEVDSDVCKDNTKSLAKQSSTDSVSSDSQSTSSPSKFSYFYQAEDGQHTYLHVANVKMLEMQYGSLEHCPPMITGKLLEKEASIFTQDLRRRLRYLCHLPLNCPFELAEIELKPPLVSEEVLRVFQEQLNLRKKHREQKKREESKMEQKSIEKANRQIGIYSTPKLNIGSFQHFPQLQPELLSNEYALPPSESATTSIASSPPLSAFEEITTKQEIDNSREHTRTFADIAKLTSTMSVKAHNKPTNAWPAVKARASFNDEEEVLSTIATRTHNKSTNAWPSVKTRTYSGITSTSSSKNENEVPSMTSTNAHDKPVNAWPLVKSKTYPDATDTPFNEDKEKYASEPRDDGNAAGKKKKKKKGKGTVLFTTGMTSGYSL
ncbi:E3 ubiquitin-protein ligase RNF10 isoform X2 [Linepithema humile]|uniref:E3 ubiquitin-protein ligase RNF10 isoform X2 n=1 Tax=Linepithema humile TaxID=83485 RepID=UPI00351DC50F